MLYAGRPFFEEKGPPCTLSKNLKTGFHLFYAFRERSRATFPIFVLLLIIIGIILVISVVELLAAVATLTVRIKALTALCLLLSIKLFTYLIE